MIVLGYDAWKRQEYLLDRMTLGDLIRAYFTYPAIQAYILLFLICVGAAVLLTREPLPVLASVPIAMIATPAATVGPQMLRSNRVAPM